MEVSRKFPILLGIVPFYPFHCSKLCDKHRHDSIGAFETHPSLIGIIAMPSAGFHGISLPAILSISHQFIFVGDPMTHASYSIAYHNMPLATYLHIRFYQLNATTRYSRCLECFPAHTSKQTANYMLKMATARFSFSRK